MNRLSVYIYSFIGAVFFSASGPSPWVYATAQEDTYTANGTLGMSCARYLDPTTLAYDSSGSITVRAFGSSNWSLVHLDPSGQFKDSTGYIGTGEGQYYSISDIYIDLSDTLYIASTQADPSSDQVRVQKFTNGGPSALQIGTYGNGPGQYLNPVAVTTGVNGTIYILDAHPSNTKVVVYDANGNYITSFGTNGSGNGEFSSPSDITTDAAGNVYVMDSGNNRVEIFSSAGTYLGQFGSTGSGNGQFSNPSAIAIDQANGDIFVTDTGNNRVQQFSSSGVFIRSFGEPGSGDGQFNELRGITIASGVVTVGDIQTSSVDNRLQSFRTSDGSYISQRKLSRTAEMPKTVCYPYAVTTDTNGNIYIADHLGNIKKYSSSGDLVMIVGRGGTTTSTPLFVSGIAIDHMGNIVAATNDGNINIYDASGTFVRTMGNIASLTTVMTGITIVFDTNHNMYIANPGNNTVDVYNESGVYVQSISSAGMTPLQEPRYLALTKDQHLLVVDANRVIHEFELDGDYIGLFRGVATEADALATDHMGNIYTSVNVGATPTSKIIKYSPSGAVLSMTDTSNVPSNRWNQVTYIHIAPDGTLLLVATTNNADSNHEGYVSGWQAGEPPVGAFPHNATSPYSSLASTGNSILYPIATAVTMVMAVIIAMIVGERRVHFR